ncbi:hypothetical protein [Streptomyces platensis]|uniref:hypothetical protein n=1 Tax=Streptomyces platensis TaxID=58346 RepID=UPI00331F9817
MAAPPPPHGPHPYVQPYGPPPMGPHPPPPTAPHPQQPAGAHPQPPVGPYDPRPGQPPPYPYDRQPPLHPYPQPYAADPGCRLCGARPAVQATVRGHQGLFLLMRFLSRSGMFCRSCGLATYREMSARTLWQGWWSPLSVAITPVTLLMNLGQPGAASANSPPL